MSELCVNCKAMIEIIAEQNRFIIAFMEQKVYPSKPCLNPNQLYRSLDDGYTTDCSCL